MGIFNSNFFSDTTYDVPVAEGLQYDPDFGGAANIAMETYEDMLSVVKAIHVADMIELREGTESVILEGAIGDIFKKIVDGIKNFFSKIAAFFKGLYEKLVIMKKSKKEVAYEDQRFRCQKWYDKTFSKGGEAVHWQGCRIRDP